MAGFVFHVEFGMNETKLTQALEAENWALAEKLILECQNASYLDEGCYQRVPLYICLCGVDEYQTKLKAQNFYLVTLLVERGANVNLRIPVTNFGSEYLSPGKSCLELLVDLYIRFSGHRMDCDPPWSPGNNDWNPNSQLVIGLNKSCLTSKHDVLEDLQDLIFMTLRHGGDTGVKDEFCLSPVHKAVNCKDTTLLRLLCDNGADLSVTDSAGNTPLLTLCHISNIDDSHESMSTASESPSQIKQRPWQYVNTDILHFVLKNTDVDVNHQNALGQTALFHMLLRGDQCGARILLEAGADPSLAGVLWESRRRKRTLSPLFASLSSISNHPSTEDLYQRVSTISSCNARLVDSGFFKDDSVHQELSTLIDSDFQEFRHLRQFVDLLIPLMFGLTSASLKQLAARCVFHNILMTNTKDQAKEHLKVAECPDIPKKPVNDTAIGLPLTVVFPQTDSNNLKSHKTQFWSSALLRKSLATFYIPLSLLTNFEAELLRCRMVVQFKSMRAIRPPCRASVVPVDEISDNIAESNSDDSDSDVSSNFSSSEEDVENDSDLEYW